MTKLSPIHVPTITIRNLVTEFRILDLVSAVCIALSTTPVATAQQSDGPIAVESHDLFDAVPVRFVEVKVAQGSAWVEPYHTQTGEGGVAFCSGCYTVLTRV